MNTERPYELQFEYTRLMMGFLMLNPKPHKVLMIGLGGGSLAKFFHRYLTDVHVTVVEINPHVIALRKEFEVPDDDDRLCVIQADAASYVSSTDEVFDVIFADGFDITGLPAQLCSHQFYDNCKGILSEKGLFVANLHRCHKHFDIHIDRLKTIFDAPLLKVNAPDATNCVVFAVATNIWKKGYHMGIYRPDDIPEDAWATLLPSIARVFLAARQLEKDIKYGFVLSALNHV
jgi:spermidine synthase